MGQSLGLCNSPAYTGHKPLRIRNMDDLPHPFGPVIRRCIPGCTTKVRDGTTTSQFGVTTGTSMREMLPSLDSIIFPTRYKKMY